MKLLLRWTAALYLCCVSTIAFAATLPGGTGANFLVGYNEAWFGPYYGYSIASNPSVFCVGSAFDLNFVDKMFDGMRAGGAKIVRIWVFPALQGIQLSPAGACPINPQNPPPKPPQTKGLTPDLVRNLEQGFLLARKHHLMVYVTALNANDMSDEATKITGLRPYFENLLTNPNCTDCEPYRFKHNALLPLLTLMNKYKDARLPVPHSKLPLIYALDLISEIEAAVGAGYFGVLNDPQTLIKARAWITDLTAFVHSWASWLPVTASAGGSLAASEIAAGLFSGLGLDFYDLHAYADWGRYPDLTSVCTRNEVPIILGELGQSSPASNDWLQFWTAFSFLTTAKTNCFSAALAWKYETSCVPMILGCPSQGYDRWTYLIPGRGLFGGTFRPA